GGRQRAAFALVFLGTGQAAGGAGAGLAGLVPDLGRGPRLGGRADGGGGGGRDRGGPGDRRPGRGGGGGTAGGPQPGQVLPHWRLGLQRAGRFLAPGEERLQGLPRPLGDRVALGRVLGQHPEDYLLQRLGHGRVDFLDRPRRLGGVADHLADDARVR